MELQFRPAAAADTAACAGLIYSAAPEMFEYMFSTPARRVQDYIAYEFGRGGGFMGHRIHTVVEHQGQIVGVGACYGGTQLARLQLETTANLIRFYGLTQAVPVAVRATHSQSVIEKAPRDGIYIANLGVSPSCRGMGIGSALIAHEVANARRKGCRKVSLDVATNNGRAEQLYRRLGFAVVKEKQFRGRKDADLPGAKFMVLPVQP